MPEMPAFCDTCGAIFGSGIVFENCRNITLDVTGLIRCPKCGGTGHISEGVFDITGNAINLLSGPKRTVDELDKLAQLLLRAKREKSSKEKIEEEIQKEVPELSTLSSILPKTRSELYLFITMILMAIPLIISSAAAFKDKGLSENDVEEMINEAIEKSLVTPQKHDSQDSSNKPIKKKKKTGRNEPCPCGSGKKYKKCCLIA